MCGIFGLITTKESEVRKGDYLSAINYLFKLSESRGKEASGFITKNDNSINYYKTPETASKMIRSAEYINYFKKIKIPVPVLGHSRLVTNGSQENHNNNQPIVSDNIIGIHNGIITNVDDIWNNHKSFDRQYETDTEIIYKLLRFYISKSNSLQKALGSTFSEIFGTASIAAFFSDINKILIATNNGSLYIAYNLEKKICVFTSEMYTIELAVKKIISLTKFNDFEIYKVNPGDAYTIDCSSFSINKFSYLDEDLGKNLVFTKPQPIVDITPMHKRDIEGSGSGYFNSKAININVPVKFKEYFEKSYEVINSLKRCAKCILPESFPFITYNDEGICNYCENDKTKITSKSKEELITILKKYKRSNNLSDCIVPFSGGRDSSYGLYYLKEELGMKPISYTYDWGMITDLARRNVARMCGALGVENIIVSADLRKKRNNIKKNVLAWMKEPNLGIIPLFMAGDKQFFYYVNKIKKQTGIKLNIWMPNVLEETSFKYGFCNVKPDFSKKRIDYLSGLNKVGLFAYYGKNFFLNPKYFNMSIVDTIWAFHSYYFEKRDDYFCLFDYIEWDEYKIEKILINNFDWEISTETTSTWRIGDGTAPFYNYIYLMVAGFTENETFRSNQIRRGLINRDQAIKKIIDENRPRWNEIKWYCDTIGINFEDTINRINDIPKLY